MAQKREDELKQMETEAQALSRALSDEESSESKTRKNDPESISQESSSCSESIKQMSLEGNDKNISGLEQEISEFQSSSTSDESDAETSVMYMLKKFLHMYQACTSEESRKEVRQKAIEIMRGPEYQNLSSSIVSVVEPGEFAIKYASSAPYHVFFTRIERSKETYNQRFSITFPEILDRSLGEIVNSLHLNFLLDVDWLCWQYLLAGQRTDMLILYNINEGIDDGNLGSNITMIQLERPTEFGCHHSKIMILQYKDGGIRVVVSTANLYFEDWENRTQGLWISPHLPPLPSSESANPNNGESPTGFKKDLKRYLSKYKQPALTRWIWTVRRTDFSAINVFLVTSVPGTYKDNEANLWGHKRLANILSHHVTLPPDAAQWPIVAQSSSIGSFGPRFNCWLSKEIISSMSKEATKDLKSRPNFQFIYPSIENYKQSYDYENLSTFLPYSAEMHSKQEWLESYLYQWKAMRTGRDRALPHIKTYTRISPDFKSIPWFVLTSSNLSKAAWGVRRGDYYISNHEAGVVFIPKFITKTMTFPIEEEEDPAVPVFPIPYDLPLSRYNSSDKPFVCEFLIKEAEKLEKTEL